jgi:drug/metabolite transporter (DMT)-like permease
VASWARSICGPSLDPHAFAGHPNAGHTAVANLLLVRAIQIAVSTNVAVVVSYTVSSAVLIFSAFARAGGTIPDIDPRGALWFAAVGLCDGLAVLAMYAALEYGPVAIIPPLIAGYPLVTLLLSRGFLEKEDVGPS